MLGSGANENSRYLQGGLGCAWVFLDDTIYLLLDALGCLEPVHFDRARVSVVLPCGLAANKEIKAGDN